MPPSEIDKERECDSYWQQANDWGQRIEIGRSVFYTGDVDQIIARKSEDEFEICYKKDNFLTKGWCRPLDWKANENWGICSESCKYLKNFFDKKSADYKKVYFL